MDWTNASAVASCISATMAILVYFSNYCFNKKARRPWIKILKGEKELHKNKEIMMLLWENTGLNPLEELTGQLTWINEENKSSHPVKIEIANPIAPSEESASLVFLPDSSINQELLVMIKVSYKDTIFKNKHKYTQEFYYVLRKG